MTWRQWVVVAAELLYLALSIYFIWTFDEDVLMLWQLATVAFLVCGYFVLRHRVRKDLPDPPDRGWLMRVLSWVLPYAASAVGMVSVLLILTNKPTPGLLTDPLANIENFEAWKALVVRLLAAIGVVLSWMMLQVGFAQVYEAAYDKHREDPGLEFPRAETPSMLDFVYFSFTIGVSFAASDVTVLTRRMRLIVLVHSVVAFIYNAVVVAMAFQVLQTLGS